MKDEHKNVGEAITESNAEVRSAHSSIDMQRRQAWLFVEEEFLKKWAVDNSITDFTSIEALACRRFKRLETTPVRKGTNFRDRTIYAVWNGLEPEPTFEPEF